MKIEALYQSGLEFEVSAGQHKVTLDAKAPLGKDHGTSPKELMLAAIAGCSGMDVAALFRKYKIQTTKLLITAEGNTRDEHPKIFPRIDLRFVVEGQASELDHDKVKEAVHLSLTKYCGVSAMIAPTSPIFYVIEVNGAAIAQGQAKFT